MSEPNETINLTLSNPTNGATLGTQTTSSLTVIDNDVNNSTLLNPANFTLNGSAQFITSNSETPLLRLTPADYFQSGGAFLTDAIKLSSDTSFSSYFKFQITDSGGLGDSDGIGADGLTFVIQKFANSEIQPGLDIEFDTFDNSYAGIIAVFSRMRGNKILERLTVKDSNTPHPCDYRYNDINGNHVGVNINGDINSVVAQPVVNRLNNGNIWNVWIDYNGNIDTLEVRLSEDNERPNTAFISYVVDLPSILATPNVFIGFTSFTGGGFGNHDILDWQFNNSYNPITEIANSELDFSGVQGLNNWYYGYYDGPFNSSDFQQMTQFNTDGSGGWQVQAGTYWTGIGSGTVHGNGTITSGGRTPIEQWAVRRWVSEANGTIQIEGHLYSKRLKT